MRLASFSVLGWLFHFIFSISGSAQQDTFTIAFGSCSRQTSKAQLWQEIVDKKPDVWMWVGDNVYADTHNMDSLRADYNQQKRHPVYQQLIQSSTVVGTWDDHDFGVNDGGKFYSKKEESKEELLRFLDVPSDAPVRNHAGVYQSNGFGEGNQSIKIILLNTRTFRDTLVRSKKKNRRYNLNQTGDILGEEQWAWLEKELTNSSASLHIIASSIQFLAREHGFEKWGNFPKARKRMLTLLTKTKPVATLFVSGDRHIAEFSKTTVNGLPYPLYDFTSSGLTHTWDKPWAEENKLRVGDLNVKKNYGLITVRWENNKPTVTMKIIGKDNVLFAEETVKF